jgi:precorrin-6x reductase
MKILIFSGTADGRRLSRRLADRGAEVTVCVATEYGSEEQGEHVGIRVLTGRKDTEEIAALLPGYELCVDATHPYAVRVSENIRAACESAAVPYKRLLRQACEAEGAVFVSDAAEAAALLSKSEGKILLAIGTKELSVFRGLDPARLCPRVLPAQASLSACEAAGIPHRNIIAMQGPFSRELNAALIRQYGIKFLVTKDGGAEGGFPEKAAAAGETGAVLIVLRRPEEDGESEDAIVKACEELMKCGSI